MRFYIFHRELFSGQFESTEDAIAAFEHDTGLCQDDPDIRITNVPCDIHNVEWFSELVAK